MNQPLTLGLEWNEKDCFLTIFNKSTTTLFCHCHSSSMPVAVTATVLFSVTVLLSVTILFSVIVTILYSVTVSVLLCNLFLLYSTLAGC